MHKNPNACSEQPAWRFPDPEAEAFWREHLQRLNDPEKIEALCRREHDESYERFQRGLENGSFNESDRSVIVGTLEGIRRWWAGELLKLEATLVEREWAARVLAERWF